MSQYADDRGASEDAPLSSRRGWRRHPFVLPAVARLLPLLASAPGGQAGLGGSVSEPQWMRVGSS